MLGGDRFFNVFLFDFGCGAAGSRERRFWASKRLCFIRFLSWNVIMARGIGGSFSQSCSRARRGSFFQCNFFRFDFGSIFWSIKASIKKVSKKVSKRNRNWKIETAPRSRLQSKKVAKKVSKRIQNWKTWSLLVCDWGDGHKVNMYIYIYIYNIY